MRKHMYKELIKTEDKDIRERIISEIQASSRIEAVYREGVFKKIRSVQIGQEVTLLIGGKKHLSTLMSKTKEYALFSYTGEKDAMFSMTDGTLLLVDKSGENKSPSKRIKYEYHVRNANDGTALKFSDGRVIPCENQKKNS